jgi:hypothetical protein
MQEARQWGGKSPLESFLDVIDTPRAAIVSAIQEVDDLLTDPGQASLDDFIQQTRDNLSFGQYLRDEHGVDNSAASGIAGFLGDVVLDPLTYLSLGTTAAGKVAAKEVAEDILGAAARNKIGREAAEAAVAAIGEKGTAQVLNRAAFKEVADAIGWEGGLRLKAPGFNTVGRVTRLNKLLARTAYGRKFGKGVSIIKGGERSADLAQLAAKPFQIARHGRVTQATRRLLSRGGAATNEFFSKAATPAKRFNAAGAFSALADQRVGELMFKARHTNEMVDILKEAKRLKIDNEDFMRALQSAEGAEPFERVAASGAPGLALLQRGRAWFDNVRNDINEMAGREIISHQDLYAPGILESKFREAFKDVRQSRAPLGTGKAFSEKGRKFREGETLRAVDANGEIHETVLLNPLDAGGRSIRDQAEDFYKTVHGDDYIPIFNNTAHEVLPIYLEAMARVAGRERAGNFLQRVGIGRRVGDVLEDDPQVAERHLARAADLDGDYDSVALDVDAASGRALKNDARLDDLRAQVVDGRTDQKVLDEITVREDAANLYAEADQLEAEVQRLLDELSFSENPSPVLADDIATYQEMVLASRLDADELVSIAKDIRTGGYETPALATIKDADLAKGLELADEAVSQFIKPALWGRTTQTEQAVVEMMTAYAKWNDPAQMRKFFRYFDTASNYLKRQQLASVGYLVRNFMGGKFMHWMDGIEAGAEARYLKAIALEARGKLDELDPVMQDAMRYLNQYGLRRTGQVAHEYDRNILDPVSINPLSRNFGIYRAVGKGNDLVEDTLRGTHFTDAYRQGIEAGLDPDVAARAAFDRTIKYHFDYADLTGFESNVIKRVIPFYTWSRKAIPLMLQDMARKPGKINNYFAAKQNIERDVPIDETVPKWFLEAGGIRLPFRTTDDAGQMYVIPDLPINSIDKYLGSDVMGTLRDTASQATPIIKTPIEMWRGEQFFKGIPLGDKPEEVPFVYRAIPGLLPVLERFDVVQRNADGERVIKGRHAYFVDQFIPLLARSRRLAPNEPGYQDRLLGSWASFLGLPLRENSASAQESEIWRRYFAAKDELERQKELGFAAEDERIDVNDFFPNGVPE